ncbi:hypothetical protein COB57_00955 [Candidatus Peregrinibacteria bacterium]|nr:MAG: hypothetical protein COB57_00955 [Candidatus Peregrinibacteria bacterium]
MKKDFTIWHQKKTKIESLDSSVHVSIREIWQCNLGVNIGYEQDGKGKDSLRPVLVIKKLNKNMALVLPLTTKEKKGSWFYPIQNSGGKHAWALLMQIRLISTKRMKYKLNKIAEKEFMNIKKALNLFIENP